MSWLRDAGGRLRWGGTRASRRCIGRARTVECLEPRFLLAAANLTPFALQVVPNGPLTWGEATHLEFEVQNTGDAAAAGFDVEFQLRPAGGDGSTPPLILGAAHVLTLGSGQFFRDRVAVLLPGAPASPPPVLPTAATFS